MNQRVQMKGFAWVDDTTSYGAHRWYFPFFFLQSNFPDRISIIETRLVSANLFS